MSPISSVFNIIIFVNIISASDYHDTCHVFNREGSKHLGTKTPYRIVANSKDSVIKYKGCEPVKIIGIVRHGTRTPGLEVVQEMRVKLEAIRDQIQNSSSSSVNNGVFCEYDLAQIKSWKLTLEKEEGKVLTHEGEDEMIKLAKRFQNRFPSLLSQRYSNDSYLFRYTDTQRTRESAKFFTRGLFGEENSRSVWFPHPVYKDPILRFYKLCDKWRYEIKKNPSSLVELKKYLETEEVEDMLERVSKRIGFNYTLPYEDVHLMYVTCSFETAWNKSRPSPWCLVFSKKDLKIMEYAEELKYYWRDGYGYDINHNQACPLIKNVFSLLGSTNSPTSVFYFTHSGTILKTLSHLGLYKDDFRLTHNTQHKLKEKRKWKVSKVDTFSSNMIFVLYRCNDDLKVQLFHQEKTIRLPGCNECDLCSLKKLEHIFSNSFKDCDFSNICSLKLDV